MLYKQTNMFHLLSLLASILTGLRKAVAHVSPRSRAHIPVLTPPLDHINHLFACFERLYADWCNGTLPEPRASAGLPAAGAARPSRPTLPDPTQPAVQPAPRPAPTPAPASELPPGALTPAPTISKNPPDPACRLTP